MTKLDEMYQRLRDQLTDREREILDERLKRSTTPDSRLNPALEVTSEPKPEPKC